MNAFAGFWVDGAVRKPEARHEDCEGLLHVKWKRDFPDFDIVSKKFDAWVDVYWLDTTPRETLTPEELFSVAKVLWPNCSKVINPEGSTVKWQIEYNDTYQQTPIAWGDLTQYPPPPPQWIRITRENVGQYLFRDCRFRDDESQEWRNGRVAGWDDQDGCCLVHSEFEEELPIMQWNIVEVANAPTA